MGYKEIFLFSFANKEFKMDELKEEIIFLESEILEDDDDAPVGTLVEPAEAPKAEEAPAEEPIVAEEAPEEPAQEEEPAPEEAPAQEEEPALEEVAEAPAEEPAEEPAQEEVAEAPVEEEVAEAPQEEEPKAEEVEEPAEEPAPAQEEVVEERLKSPQKSRRLKKSPLPLPRSREQRKLTQSLQKTRLPSTSKAAA